MSGEQKFKEMGEKLKEEAQANQTKEAELKPVRSEEMEKSVATMSTFSEDVAEFFKSNAEVGTEDMNMQTGFPTLRAYGKNSTNSELLIGEELKIGDLYYTGTKRNYGPEVVVHILYIKQCKLPDFTNPEVMKANYVLGGVIDETNEPFILYAKGMSYNKVWDLQEQIAPYVKRATPVPMFAMKIKIFTKLETSEGDGAKFGAQPVIYYKLQMHDSGEFPDIDPDMRRLASLRKMVDEFKDRITGLVNSKNPAGAYRAEQEAKIEERRVTTVESGSDDEIPF